MKQAATLSLVALLLLYAGCAKKKVEPPKFWTLINTGMEILAFDRYDTKTALSPHDAKMALDRNEAKADELIRRLKLEVDVAKSRALNEAEVNVLRLYGNAAETFRLALLRSRAPAARAPQETDAVEAQSSYDLWNTAKHQLQAAEDAYFSLRGFNRFRNRFFDSPIKSNHPSDHKYQYPWPR